MQPAREALLSAADDDWERALVASTELVKHGYVGVTSAMQAWVDTVTAAAGGVVPQTFQFRDDNDPDPDARQSLDEMPPETLWAGRWFVARAAMDRDMCEALLGALPPRGIGAATTAVLNVCAATLRALLQGHTVMQMATLGADGVLRPVRRG